MELKEALRRPRLIAAAACFALGAAILVLGVLPRQEAPAPAAPLAGALDLAPPAPASEEEAPAEPSELIVYVSGAVPRPDVYRLGPGARVKDAVTAAGGLGPDAAAEQINLAEPLSDAAHVHIPSLADPAALVAAPAAAPAIAGAPAAGPLDLNAASAAELEELPGIGATLAGRIVARREEAGPFAAVEDLREVTGVGEKLYAQIAPLVTVGR
jgi:competence protein ComEA